MLPASICPGPRFTHSLGRCVWQMRIDPSSTMNLKFASGQRDRIPFRERSLQLYSAITVVPVIAAVTAAVLIFAPPEFFGTRSRMAPPLRSTERVP